MVSSTLFVVAVMVFASMGYSNGEPEEHCEEISASGNHILCRNQAPTYNTTKMDELVQQNMEWFKLKPKDQVTYDDEYQDEELLELPEDGDNCGTYVKEEKPYMLKMTAMNNSYYEIVQSKYFNQTFKVARCRNMNGSCLGKVKIGDHDIESCSCEEKHTSVSVYVHDPKTGNTGYKNIDIPVCCSCIIYKKML